MDPGATRRVCSVTEYWLLRIVVPSRCRYSVGTTCRYYWCMAYASVIGRCWPSS